MQAESDDARQVLNRLKRARGQLDGIIAMIDEGRPCQDVVQQLAAVSKALHRAGFKIISTELQECSRDGSATPQTQADLEKLFLTLA